MSDLRTARRRYTFTVSGQTHYVTAESAIDAMSIINGRIRLPDDFYGWVDAGPTDYFANHGAWD